MPAEVLFSGGRLDSVIPIGSPVESTSAAFRDSTYADAAVSWSSTSAEGVRFYLWGKTGGGELVAATVVTGETFWLHFEYGSSATISNTRAIFTLYDSAGFPWFRFRGVAGSATSLLEYNSGTGGSPVWTTVATGFACSSSGTRQIFDLKLTLGSPHAMEFSLNGSLVASGSFTQASFTDVARVDIGGSANSGSCGASQFLATRGISTIGAKVKYCRATANGTNTAWTGVFTDVNEVTGSDATLNSAASAGLKETHAMGDVTITAGLEIKSVFHWLRAKNDGSAPTNIKSVLRSGGADYSTGNLAGIGTSFGPIGARYDQDPATSSNWTDTSWNAIEAGYESAA